MRNTKKLRRYKPTAFKAKDSHYDRDAADFAVAFIENLCHTKGTWAGKPFLLLDWQEQIIRDLFGILKPNGYRQFNTAYVEIPKKNGKSELAAAIALLLCCGDGEERAEVYGCAADRQQASIVFEVAADMVRMCPALSKRVKILASQKRIIYAPTNSFYQVLSAEAYSKHGFNIHGVVFDELHTQPNATSGTCTITCQSYNGGVLTGTRTCALTLKVPPTVVPSISSVTVSDANSTVATKIGAYVKMLSTLSVEITAAGSYGSTVSSYRTLLDGVNYTQASFTCSKRLSTSGDLTLTVTVTDSRGRTATYTETLTVLDYSYPSIRLFKADRCKERTETTNQGDGE